MKQIVHSKLELMSSSAQTHAVSQNSFVMVLPKKKKKKTQHRIGRPCDHALG